MYIDLHGLLGRIAKDGVTIEIEDRKKQKFNCYGFPNQHVEVKNYKNKSDNWEWDGLVLGYKNSNSLKCGEQYRTNIVTGIIWVDSGNHKLIFKIPYKRGFEDKILKKEVEMFINNYNKKWKRYKKPIFMNKDQIRHYLMP